MPPIVRATLTGLIGSILLAGSAWLASPWGLGFAGRSNTVPIRWAHSAPAVLGATLLFVAWLGLPQLRQTQTWRIFAAWCAPLLACPPLLSKDVWAYLEQGWVVLQGHNPYQTALSTIGGPFADRVDAYWQQTTTVYPPLALQIQAGVVAASGADPFWSMLAMRLPGLLAVVVIGLCLPRIARAVGQDPGHALWLSLLNPLLLVHFIGGAHNDAWAVGFAVAGIWLAVRWAGAWPVGCLLIGLGMAVKQPLGLLMVGAALVGVAAGHQVTARDAWAANLAQVAWRTAVGLLGTAAGFAIPTLVSGWGIGWATATGSPSSTGSQSITHTVSDALRLLTGWPMADAMAIVGPIFLGIGALVIGWLGWKFAATRPITFAALGLIVFAVSYPSLQPWYVLWGGVLLGAVRLTQRASAWAITVVGCLLITSVLLDYAGFPIPVAQLIAAAAAWPLFRWVLRARLASSTR